MKRYNYSLFAMMIFGFVAFLSSCKKSDSLSVAPEAANFTNQSSGTYFVTAPNTSYKIPVGLTNTSDKDRTVNITVTSPTGAVKGTQYNLSSSSVVIPAGKVIDSITVQGVFAQYQTGRKDTLVFTITEPGTKAAEYNNKFTLLLRGPCFASDVAAELQSLLGDYNNTTEQLGSGGVSSAYHTKIVSATLASATTANIVVANIFDNTPPWNNLTYTLDWTDPANPKVTLVAQNAGGNAGDLFGAMYNGTPYAVTFFPTQTGTFDFCAQKLTLRMRIGVFGVGYSASLYQVNMAR
jgi:hypothetical protein